MEKPGNHGSGSERPARTPGITPRPSVTRGVNNVSSTNTTSASANNTTRASAGGYRKTAIVRSSTAPSASAGLHGGGSGANVDEAKAAAAAALDSNRRSAQLGSERHSNSSSSKVTNVSPASAGSLQDAVFALAKAQARASQSASSEPRPANSRSSADRERKMDTKTPGPRSQSEGPPGKRTSKTSQTFSKQPAAKISRGKNSKADVLNDSKKVNSGDGGGTEKGKSPKASSNAQTAPSKTPHVPSQPSSRLKKSQSTDGGPRHETKDGGNSAKDVSLPGKQTPPGLKHTLSRGHTVHDIVEYSSREPSKTDLDKDKKTAAGRPPSQHCKTAEDLNPSTSLQQSTSTKSVLSDISNRGPLSSGPKLPPAVSSSHCLTSSAATATTVKQQGPLPSQAAPEATQQSFFSFSHVPSLSSRQSSSSSLSSSSDVQSEVCVDVPDYTELPAVPEERQHTDLNVKVDFPTAPYHPLRRVGHRRSPCLALLETCAVLLASLLLCVPVLVLVLVLLPASLLVKWLCSMCCCFGSLWGRCCVGCCHTHLSASERLWVQDPGGGGGGGGGGVGRMAPVAQSVLVVQRGLNIERLRHLLDSRLLSLENRHGRRVFPRFTQHVVRFCCGLAWVTDDAFFINNHVFNMPGYIESLEDLQDHLAKMASEPLSLDQPLWEVQVLHNFREPRDTILLFRMHLALGDGPSMIRILQHAVADAQKLPHAKAGFGLEAANMSPLKAFFLGPVTLCRRYLLLRRDFNLLHGRHARPRGEMAVAWSEPFSLSAALRVKQVARCTLSELLISVVAGNMRTYMQVHGIAHPYDISCALPIDFRPDLSAAATSTTGNTSSSASSTGLGSSSTADVANHYSMAVVRLPTNTEGAIPRLWETKLQLEEFKSSPEAAIVSGAQWFTCCVLPLALFQRLWHSIYSRCTCLVSNLAGPESALKLDSREIKCMMYWVPPLGRVAITISFLTYADQVRMAVIADRAVLPNPELLTRDFIYKLETVSKLLAHRRIPGEQLNTRMESMHLLSSYTLNDLTAEQIQLQMALVQQELHDMKLQLEAGPSRRLTANDTQLCQRIEKLKEQFRELLLHLRKRRAAEAENAIILSEEDDVMDTDSDKQRPFRRRTLSISSRMSTVSVSSTMRPLSTASTSNHPSPIHPNPPTWPDAMTQDYDKLPGGSSCSGSTGPAAAVVSAVPGGAGAAGGAGVAPAGPSSKKHGYTYRQRLQTMEEFELDETLVMTSPQAGRFVAD